MNLERMVEGPGREEKQTHRTKQNKHHPLLPSFIMQNKLPNSQILPVKVVNTETLKFFNLFYSICLLRQELES